MDEPLIIEERRLVGTLITQKPGKASFAAAAMTFAVMALCTQFYWGNIFGLAEFLPAVQTEVFKNGQWWRIFTATLIHADFGHFLSNMYMLCIFAFFVFGYFGFWVYPVTTFLLAGAVNLIAILTYAPEVRLLGASGLVYLLGGLWLSLYFLIQRQYKIFSRALRVIGIGIMIFGPTTFVPTTSYRTHAIGFFAGVLIGIFYFRKNRDWIRSFETYKIIYV